MDSYEIDRFIEEHDRDRDAHFYEEIDVLKKKIKDVKKLIMEVNEYFNKKPINTSISNKLFDIETIVTKKEE